jgi:hypothetical protein
MLYEVSTVPCLESIFKPASPSFSATKMVGLGGSLLAHARVLLASLVVSHTARESNDAFNRYA